MIITEHLNRNAVSVNLKSETKKKVLEELVDLLVDSGEIDAKNKGSIVKVLMEREKIGSTGIGYAVAMPHGKCKAVESVMLAGGYSKKGVKFNSIDGKPAHLFFLLLSSPEHGQLHLKVLARLSRFLKDKIFRESLFTAKGSDEICQIIEDKEREDRIQ